MTDQEFRSKMLNCAEDYAKLAVMTQRTSAVTAPCLQREQRQGGSMPQRSGWTRLKDSNSTESHAMKSYNQLS